MRRRYVVITPARDEERTIDLTIRSMLAQTVPPLRWVIVNDGSSDHTREIVERHLQAKTWLELVDQEELTGAGLVGDSDGVDDLELRERPPDAAG